ncbi:hypothetical protein DUNSADRAFT_8951 [Dunaliella salina]|uniref:Uncharacterized protein n=1 Tax=Dunaliella salina TaxID=3046 RepID=A0ABQ7GIG0_DUNSA|nr:hypothetical protein DUNSADRAFT_8951 [Dunaliella salina]|eukprot:KAF5834396.1 hypothetical protein DUNSADRAFT_8951 [Dunaliella salina]
MAGRGILPIDCEGGWDNSCFVLGGCFLFCSWLYLVIFDVVTYPFLGGLLGGNLLLARCQSFLAVPKLARHKQRQATRSEARATPFTFQPSDVKASALAADARPTTSTTLLLASLLAHPHPAVVATAAGAVRQLLLLMPQTALYFLPLVLYSLQQSSLSGSGPCNSSITSSTSTSTSNSMPVKGDPQAASRAAAGAQAALLSLLPAMAADAPNAPFALRALQPLLSLTAPPLVRCMGLRLMVDIWHSSGKGWARAEAALSAFLPPGAAHAANTPLPLLRVTQAALCRSVCEKDPHAGVQLVAVLQLIFFPSEPPPQPSMFYDAAGHAKLTHTPPSFLWADQTHLPSCSDHAAGHHTPSPSKSAWAGLLILQFQGLAT